MPDLWSVSTGTGGHTAVVTINIENRDYFEVKALSLSKFTTDVGLAVGRTGETVGDWSESGLANTCWSEVLRRGAVQGRGGAGARGAGAQGAGARARLSLSPHLSSPF